MSRGNRKSAIFDDADDRRIFMNTFHETARDYRPRVYAGCLMGTHYHFLIDTPRGNLSDFMRQLNGVYSADHNRRHARVGHTFEQRFNSLVVQREKYLRRVVRYIARNPVEAGLCPSPADWPWTTHRATAGLEPAPPWLYLDWLEWAFHVESRAEAQQAYLRYIADPAAPLWEPDTSQSLVGTNRFKKAAVKAHLDAADRPVPRNCVRFKRATLPAVFADLEGDRHSRDTLILAAHVTHGYRLAEIATFLNIDASTASKAIRRARQCRGAGSRAGD
jgi:REP element-mobilizing transposase RayT